MSESITTYEGFSFYGPYSIDADFNAVVGIYLITTPQGNIVDVGETENLKERIPNHERRNCWLRNGGVNLYFHYEANQQRRLDKENFFRTKSNPTCGIK